ncbi:uncharacterized protein RHIMIDRAFT_302256 [Rhizopus microsporus ATCC 52813]|uniref:histone acetyltransferase n=1 Tax=Rhizopus microsporus ATCC 52813 TaxID=1340429 RepID=A0A2G4SGU3_RHIZD|nr:uncharacterized protein RHIMIDRAFT_302256 [Rhizopus microsporus ATCC 52813]PHZ07972.1 hypothetical protein RHIMIDRAFT_302256 [Rhizopus microsporus ATCC 52813]
MSIQQHLQQFLSRTHTNHKTFHVFNLDSDLYSSPPLIKNSSATSYRHRLLLVSAPTVGFISGLEAYEYTVSKQDKIEHMIYISKVDTTMTTEETRGVTRQLVLAYLASLPSNTTVFVFARAQPQYLFANSAKNTNKAALSDRDLVSWWLHTLNRAPNAEKGWWFVPGVEDESSALIEIGARKRQWEAAFDWTYGSSYSPDAKALDVIPRFEDDAKARFLKDHIDDDLSVKGFWELLAFSEECGSGKITGFFELKVNGCLLEEKKAEKEKEKDDKFTEFWNKLMFLDFHNKESILSSTQTAVREIEKRYSKECQFEITVEQNRPLEQTKSKQPVVNTLSSMQIKRKREQVNSKEAAVNTLSGSFIKRKKNCNHN